ncbi:MAG: hypothetical protein U5K37_09650 [Natrialbaceae archaeon]|nr:hypothetical protein [Natrialbaceae archaeon]
MADGSEIEGGSERMLGDRIDIPRWVLAIAPLLVLGLIIGAFLMTAPFADLGRGNALPSVSVDYTTLPDSDTMVLHITNNGPPVEITQVHVDEANWQFDISSPGADARLGTGEGATVTIPYEWMPGYDYEVSVLTAEGVTFGTTIVAAQQTPALTGALLWDLAVIGFLVGIIPVTLGMFWFPFLQTMRRSWLHAVLAFSAGILGFLIFDAGFEAFDVADRVASYYAGPLLVVLGIAGALLFVRRSWTGEAAVGGIAACAGVLCSAGYWPAQLR